MCTSVVSIDITAAGITVLSFITASFHDSSQLAKVYLNEPFSID